MPLVSIVIPVFNRFDLTAQCLRRLPEVTKIPHEIIVVDNASTDETSNQLVGATSEFLGMKNLAVFRNDVNENFSGACNLGAWHSTAEYVVFLNNDTIPFEGWLEPLVEELKSGAGVAGSKLCFPDGTIQHAGVAFQRETRFPYHPYRGAGVEAGPVNHRRELQAVTGACMAMPHDLFTSLGGFNNEYKNGGEDIELCLQARKRGYRVVYRPDSALIHLESQSPGRMDFNEDNINVFWKNTKDWALADEDAFYFEDGYRRFGDRINAAETELHKFTSPEEQERWRTVSEVQLQLAAGIESMLPILLGSSLWPTDDAAVLEWAAMTARKHGEWRSACGFFADAAKLRVVERAVEIQQEIARRVLMSAYTNKYFND